MLLTEYRMGILCSTPTPTYKATNMNNTKAGKCQFPRFWIREGRTWAIAVRRGSERSLLLLSLDLCSPEKKGNSILNFSSLLEPLNRCGPSSFPSIFEAPLAILWQNVCSCFCLVCGGWCSWHISDWKTLSLWKLPARCDVQISSFNIYWIFWPPPLTSRGRPLPQPEDIRTKKFGFGLLFLPCTYEKKPGRGGGIQYVSGMYPKCLLIYRMRLFCLQLEASCLQWSFLLTIDNFSLFTYNWSFLLPALALAFLLTVGAFLLTVGKCV